MNSAPEQPPAGIEVHPLVVRDPSRPRSTPQPPGLTGAPLAKPSVVPYIATWTTEHGASNPIRSLFGDRIAFPDERPEDRDRHGVLWRRNTAGRGEGRPVFDQVHARRQRHAMSDLLCQVCAGPASRTDAGWLWLLHDDRAIEPRGWPDLVTATHPPLCLPCARASVRMCPHLHSGFVAVRVADPQLWGVYGSVHMPTTVPGQVRTVARAMVPYGSTGARWVLAAQMVRLLLGCTFTDLDEEAAELPTATADQADSDSPGAGATLRATEREPTA